MNLKQEIWVKNQGGQITTANSACSKLYITYILNPKGTSSNKATSVNISNKAFVVFDTGGVQEIGIQVEK